MKKLSVVLCGMLVLVMLSACPVTSSPPSAWADGDKLTASDGEADDYFGASVAVAADGNTIVVGAYRDDIGLNDDQGSAYVFRRNGSAWDETPLTASNGAALDYFGVSVSVAADGNTIVVGASFADLGPNLEQGAAYIYEWNGGSWDETKFSASDGAADDNFGASVCITPDANCIVVGAYGRIVGTHPHQGGVYVYKRNGLNWDETLLTASDGETDDYFGSNVCAAADGNTIVVGDKDDDIGGNSYQGSIYVYTWNGLGWDEEKLTASDGEANDCFGASVAVSADGSTIAAGAINHDVGGHSEQGVVYVYRWNGSWVETPLFAADGLDDDYFGRSVSLTANGHTLAAGADFDDVGPYGTQGSVSVFSWDGSGWTEKYLVPADGSMGKRFGVSSSLTPDGSVLVVGAHWDEIGSNNRQGSAYIFEYR